MGTPEKAKQPKEYRIEIGKTDGFGYVGIMPPPNVIALCAIRGVIDSKQSVMITSESNKSTAEKERYFEIGYTTLGNDEIREIGCQVVDILTKQGDFAHLDPEVKDMCYGKEFFCDGSPE